MVHGGESGSLLQEITVHVTKSQPLVHREEALDGDIALEFCIPCLQDDTNPSLVDFADDLVTGTHDKIVVIIDFSPATAFVKNS
jgi:hypothetical protein